MTERGLPIVDGAPACPFVAFDDDRDERAASPDHRHRCYAERQPAPRALAHQEAYCLSSAFPVCPTFQDWARREAARSRLDAPPPPDMDSVAAAATARQPQRNPPRNWAAPPPWLSRGERPSELWEDEDERAFDELGGPGGGAGPAGAAGGGVGAAGAGGAGAGRGPRQPGRGLSGSFADRIASDAEPSVESFEGGDELDEEFGDGDASEDEAARTTPPLAPIPSGPPAAGPQAPAPRATAPQRPVTATTDDWDDDFDDLAQPTPRRRRERDLDRGAAMAAGSAGGSGSGSSGGGGGRGVGGGGGRGPRGEPPSERRRDPRAPEWERARPLEAYPTLRSRRLSELSIPPLLVAVVALALAAAVLFALPGLLGFGNPSTGGGASQSPTTPLITPIVTPAPTPVPKPTDQLYVVQTGDTMSKIANRFDIPLGDLIAANAETIPDPNKLQIGDQVIIPAKQPSELPASSEIPAAT